MNREILDELRRLGARMDKVLAAIGAARPEPTGSPDDILGLEESAAHIHVAPVTLRQGKAGTHTIPRYSDRPVRFRRFDLDQWKRGQTCRRREAKEVRKRLKLAGSGRSKAA